MPDLVYRGSTILGVPAGAFVVECRGKATSGGAGSSGLFTFDQSTAVAQHLFRVLDVAAFPITVESGQRMNGRIIGFGSALRVYSTANVWWYSEIGVGLLRCEVDDTGALVAGSEVQVGQMLNPHPITAGAYRQCDAGIIEGRAEVRPILAPFDDALRLDERHAVRAVWNDGATAKAANAHRIECVVAVALWLEADGGPRRGLEFPPIAETV